MGICSSRAVVKRTWYTLYAQCGTHPIELRPRPTTGAAAGGTGPTAVGGARHMAARARATRHEWGSQRRRRQRKREAHDLHARRDLRTARHRGPPGRRPGALPRGRGRRARRRRTLRALRRPRHQRQRRRVRQVPLDHTRRPAGRPRRPQLGHRLRTRRSICDSASWWASARAARRPTWPSTWPTRARPVRVPSPSPTTTTACWHGRPTPCWPPTPAASAP